ERGLAEEAAHEPGVAERVQGDRALGERIPDVLAPLAPRTVHESLVHAELHRAPARGPDAVEHRIAARERAAILDRIAALDDLQRDVRRPATHGEHRVSEGA